MKKYIFLLYFLFIFSLIYFYTFNFQTNSVITDNNFIYPTNYTDISSEYGYRILYNETNFHNGIDFLAPENSEVFASKSGYISLACFLEGYGNTVIITHDSSTKTLYCHLAESFIVTVGQTVSQGETIAYVGPRYLSNGTQNGNTTGPHLHFTVFINEQTINPLEILEN